jgi:hypothetical protein
MLLLCIARQCTCTWSGVLVVVVVLLLLQSCQGWSSCLDRQRIVVTASNSLMQRCLLLPL